MELRIMTGNIGSGKSLLASKFAKMGHVIVNMDSIQQMVGGGEYGLYDSEKKGIYHNTEMTVIESALNAGLSVVVDRTNMDQKGRARFIEVGKRHACEIISINFRRGDVGGLLRRQNSPNGIPGAQWEDVWNYMEKSYEPPSFEEGFNQLIEAPKNFRFYAFDFDGTIVENNFPEIGEIIDGTIERMNRAWQFLSNIIIIWSCRSGDYENQMRAFLLKNKIPFDFINRNPMFNMGSPKIFAHEYLDDRNRLLGVD